MNIFIEAQPPNDKDLRQLPDDATDDKETLDPHHTHCILFDSGKLDEYLSDSPRSNFVKYICEDQHGDACK